MRKYRVSFTIDLNPADDEAAHEYVHYLLQAANTGVQVQHAEITEDATLTRQRELRGLLGKDLVAIGQALTSLEVTRAD